MDRQEWFTPLCASACGHMLSLKPVLFTNLQNTLPVKASEDGIVGHLHAEAHKLGLYCCPFFVAACLSTLHGQQSDQGTTTAACLLTFVPSLIAAPKTKSVCVWWWWWVTNSEEDPLINSSTGSPSQNLEPENPTDDPEGLPASCFPSSWEIDFWIEAMP